MSCQTPYRDDSAQVLLFKIASCIESGGGVVVAGVSSFNGRTGVVTLTAADVSTALGCTPLCEADGDARYVLKTGDTMTGSLNIANSAILVASDPALDITQTWNNAAATFTGLQSNITSTAAGANSLLFDFQLGGSPILNLQATGRLLLNGQAAFINTGSVGHILNTTDALNTAVVNVLTVGHSLSAGVGAAGLGARIDVVGDSATVASQTLLRIDSFWIDPVQATRTAAANFILPVSGTSQIILTLTNNQAQLRDGTAALPSLTFQSDPDTGIYRIGANSFGFAVGGSNIASINSVGLGIGTTSSIAPLEIKSAAGNLFLAFTGSGTNAAYMSFNNGGGTSYWGVESSVGGVNFVGSDAYSLVLSAASARKLHLGFNGANGVAMTVDSAGLIGIGTTAPNSKLQVEGSLALAYVEKTGAYTATIADFTINCTANTFTIDLPTAVGIEGRIYVIKNSGAGVITIDPSGGETIDGAATAAVVAGAAVMTQSTGANWIII